MCWYSTSLLSEAVQWWYRGEVPEQPEVWTRWTNPNIVSKRPFVFALITYTYIICMGWVSYVEWQQQNKKTRRCKRGYPSVSRLPHCVKRCNWKREEGINLWFFLLRQQVISDSWFRRNTVEERIWNSWFSSAGTAIMGAIYRLLCAITAASVLVTALLLFPHIRKANCWNVYKTLSDAA